MTLHLELDPETEALLTALAGQSQADPQQVALLALHDGLVHKLPPAMAVRPSHEEFSALLDQLASLPPVNNPALDDCTWPRTELYADHD